MGKAEATASPTSAGGALNEALITAPASLAARIKHAAEPPVPEDYDPDVVEDRDPFAPLVPTRSATLSEPPANEETQDEAFPLHALATPYVVGPKTALDVTKGAVNSAIPSAFPNDRYSDKKNELLPLGSPTRPQDAPACVDCTVKDLFS